MDRGAWQATVHGVAKSQTGLRDEHTHVSHEFNPLIFRFGNWGPEWLGDLSWLKELVSDSGGRGTRLLTLAWAAVLRTPKDLTLMSVPLWALQRPDPCLKKGRPRDWGVYELTKLQLSDLCSWKEPQQYGCNPDSRRLIYPTWRKFVCSDGSHGAKKRTAQKGKVPSVAQVWPKRETLNIVDRTVE